jgi:beta-galactosidase
MEGTYGHFPARASVTRTTADLHLTWDVPYEPGTLKAVGIKEGKIVAAVEVSTTGEPSTIGLSVDREVILADRRDVAHLTVRILDDQGRAVPGADSEVAFAVGGEGRILGVDNGDPQSHEDFRSNRRKVFHGLCLAIVQSTGKPGQIRVTATSPALKSASVIITSRA